jgi:hypothetical protein
MVNDLTNSGVLEETTANIHAVPHYVNNNGKLVGDFRLLNTYIKPRHTVAMDPTLIHSNACRFKYFATIDLTRGFYHLRLISKTKIGIQINQKKYLYKSAPLGLAPSPGAFSESYIEFWETMIRPSLDREIEVFYYVDDILLTSNNLACLKKAYTKAIHILNKYNFKINPKKSHPPRNFVLHLGWLIKHNVKFIDLAKLEKLHKLVPNSDKWLGLASYLSLSDTHTLSLVSAAQKLKARNLPIPPQLTGDILLNIKKMSKNGVSPLKAKRVKAFVDASPTHIGMVLFVDRKHYKITLKHDKPNQFLAEFHAINTAHAHIQSAYGKANYRIWSDNSAAIRHARKSGINTAFISGKDNPADIPSRPNNALLLESSLGNLLKFATQKLSLAQAQVTGAAIADVLSTQEGRAPPEGVNPQEG